jgi:hypothetical protein
LRQEAFEGISPILQEFLKCNLIQPCRPPYNTPNLPGKKERREREEERKEGSKEGRKQGRKEARKEGRKGERGSVGRGGLNNVYTCE